MNNSVRGYPDISFVDTNTEKLINTLIQSYEKFTGRTLYPADPARLFILWIADIIIQERVNIEFSAKQNLPRYAEGKYLDSVAELFKDIYRLQPETAKTTLRFTLSIALETATTIKKGTRVTADGDIIFATVQDLIIPAGIIFGDVEAECQTEGARGNEFLPGQLKQLVDVFPYFGKVENITKTEGGADIESDASFYERIRGSVETFSTAGPLGSYEFYAKSASVLISDVKAYSPTPGVVDVRILLQNGVIPEQEIIEEVSVMLNDERVRPLTDNVMVSAPDIVPYDIDFTYYIRAESAESPGNIEKNIETALQNYIKWQSGKMGRDINPSYLISLIMAVTGVKRVDVRSPVFTVVADNAVAIAESIEKQSGGVEDE
ncbi:MAG: baseplate J/gp47 family protein [Lachnospiraceae bacterium]|nr:baseplate J/gp47 family protein [Lachnospiraceae bacterium]